MQTFDCQLVSEKDPAFHESVALDFVPRIGDLIGLIGGSYRVLDVYVIVSNEPNGRDDISLSVEPVPVPKIFAEAKGE